MPSDIARICELNDAFRTTLQGGRIIMTAAVKALPWQTTFSAVEAMKEFKAFTEDNDPHGEHDFGAFEIEEHRFFWKIDYYDKDLVHGSDDPTDIDETTRVLTLMLAEDY